jgi:hypothetical protein
MGLLLTLLWRVLGIAPRNTKLGEKEEEEDEDLIEDWEDEY